MTRPLPWPLSGLTFAVGYAVGMILRAVSRPALDLWHTPGMRRLDRDLDDYQQRIERIYQ